MSNDDPLLFKTLGLSESLPAVDPFLIYSNSKNREFLESSQLLSNAYEIDRSVVAKVFRPMNISKANIKTLQHAAGESLNNKLYEPSTPNQNDEGSSRNNYTPNKSQPTDHNATGRRTISENIIGDRSSNHLEIKSSNLSAANQKRLSIYQSPNHQHSLTPPQIQSPMPQAMNILTSPANLLATPPSLASKSSILDVNSARQLLSYLPDSCVAEGIELCFTTKNDGWDISSLYTHCKGLLPNVLLIKLLPPNENVIVGAFLTCPIYPGASKVIGNGLSFVFRLDNGNAVKYPWAGAKSEPDASSSLDELREAALNEFAVASQTFLSIGSSASLACAAIRLDENM